MYPECEKGEFDIFTHMTEEMKFCPHTIPYDTKCLYTYALWIVVNYFAIQNNSVGIKLYTLLVLRWYDEQLLAYWHNEPTHIIIYRL